MISGNQDLPEGGFDGFLQSILCTNVCNLATLEACVLDLSLSLSLS